MADQLTLSQFRQKSALSAVDDIRFEGQVSVLGSFARSTVRLLVFVVGTNILIMLFAEDVVSNGEGSDFLVDQPVAGVRLDQSNIEDYERFVDPYLAEQIRSGKLYLDIREPFSLQPPAFYQAAIKEFSSSVSLGQNPGELIGYVAGTPFLQPPSINDERAGEKLAWNQCYSYGGDNALVLEMYWQYRNMRNGRIDRELAMSASRINFMHRVKMPPTPSFEGNTYGLQSALYLHVSDPADVAKTQLLMYAKENDRELEQAWMYILLMRRVRRVATQQKTDSFLGSDIMIEDFLGYSGRIMDMDGIYVGMKYLLLPMYRHDKISHSGRRARRYDYWFVDFYGPGKCFPKIHWQLRKVFILDVIPKRNDHPLSKRRFYIDA